MNKILSITVIFFGLLSCNLVCKNDPNKPIAVPEKKNNDTAIHKPILVKEPGNEGKRKIEVKAGEQYVKPPKLDSIAAH